MRAIIIWPCVVWILWRMVCLAELWLNTPQTFLRITMKASQWVFTYQIMPAVIVIVVVMMATHKEVA